MDFSWRSVMMRSKPVSIWLTAMVVVLGVAAVRLAMIWEDSSAYGY